MFNLDLNASIFSTLGEIDLLLVAIFFTARHSSCIKIYKLVYAVLVRFNRDVCPIPNGFKLVEKHMRTEFSSAEVFTDYFLNSKKIHSLKHNSDKWQFLRLR